MVVRLGRVLYWLGVFVAAVLVLIALIQTTELSRQPLGEVLGPIAVCLVLAAACFLAGKGARYILANE
jgi:hypothetical protein